MTKQIINVGTTANDKKGDSLRAAFTKVNANFTELYTLTSNPVAVNSDTIETPTAGGNNGSETVLSLSKRTHVLKDGWYKLNAGTEGQVMYFVPHSSVTDISNIIIRVNNGRFNTGTTVIDYTNNFITVFSGQTGTAMAIAIYANGAWQFNTGMWD